MEVVTDRKKGLFPLPREISLKCSCPDWAVMCKHVAAVLYGVGARLDERPELLFLLRGLDHEELVSAEVAVAAATGKAKGGRKRIAHDALADVFGIEISEEEPPGEAKPARRRKSVTGKKGQESDGTHGSEPQGHDPKGEEVWDEEGGHHAKTRRDRSRHERRSGPFARKIRYVARRIRPASRREHLLRRQLGEEDGIAQTPDSHARRVERSEAIDEKTGLADLDRFMMAAERPAGDRAGSLDRAWGRRKIRLPHGMTLR